MATSNPLQGKVTGYPKLAAQMGLRPELAMFSRFGALNAENLLYFQAELVLLETRLRERQLVDSQDKQGSKSKYALNWYWLRESKDDGDTEQLDLVLEMRETLRLYNDAIIQQSHILALQGPGEWDLKYMQHFLQSADMGSLAMTGPDAVTWGSVEKPKSYSPDLVALSPRPREDTFSDWFTEKAVPKLLKCGCARFKKKSHVHGVIGYEDTNIQRVTYWITNILASLIPIASIVVLSSVHSLSGRLATIASFNVLISICLSVFTGAKRSEVFAVTAAFAAVQVVFVSTDKI